MGKKDKTLCKWKKDQIEDNRKELKAIIATPQYFCRNCCRSAASKKNLCKPEKL